MTAEVRKKLKPSGKGDFQTSGESCPGPANVRSLSSQRKREKGSIDDTSLFVLADMLPPFSKPYLPVRLS